MVVVTLNNLELFAGTKKNKQTNKNKHDLIFVFVFLLFAIYEYKTLLMTKERRR